MNVRLANTWWLARQNAVFAKQVHTVLVAHTNTTPKKNRARVYAILTATAMQVRQNAQHVLGIDPYHVTIDPQGDYIAHVDCWGKYLAPDKIMLARVPESNPRYPYYEEVAEYFETTNCCWGYPYKVYRVDIPGGNVISPYTNSLILNKKVLVPMGSNNAYNEAALSIYREAMPGYDVIGVENDSR